MLRSARGFFELERISDTRDFFRRELSTLAQYFTCAVLAIFGVFVVAQVRWEYFREPCGATRPGESCASTMNWGEVWENEKPVFYTQLLIFAVLVCVRLLVVFVARRRAAGFR